MNKDVLTRKERDRQLRENDFLNAAEKLFGEKGYQQTSIEDVAREAEYATGTIYRYFKSKEDLYNRILFRKGSLYFEELRTGLEQVSSPAGKLHFVLKNKVRFFFENRQFMNMYINEVSGPRLGARCQPPPELQELHGQILHIYENILYHGVKDGLFKPMDIKLTLAGILGLTHEILAQAISEESNAKPEDIETFIIQFIKNGMINTKAEPHE